VLGVCLDVEPITNLSFMSLPCTPEIKITDNGSTNVVVFDFIPVEA